MADQTVTESTAGRRGPVFEDPVLTGSPEVTVLTIEPLDFNVMGNTMLLNFGGAVTAGRAVVKVDYPASLHPASISRGVESLDRCLRDTAGRILVFAHSQGAQVASRWLRTHTADPDAPDPARVSFLLIGNPLRKYGGAGVGQAEVDGTIGLPTPNDTRYHVTDVKLRYDGWADWPTKPDPIAQANAAQDRFGINGTAAIHALGYRTANLFDPDRTTYTEGTTQYVMLPHDPLVALVPNEWIEASYDRPEH